MPLVLFQAPNTTGLGHISRLAAIALALRLQNPQTKSLFAIEGQDHGLLDGLGLPWLSLPSTVTPNPAWDPWPIESRTRLSSYMSQALLASLTPSVAVFDCVPYGALAFLCEKRSIPFCVVARKTKSVDWYGVYLESVLQSAAAIIVPHAREEFAFPPRWEGKTHYVGEIVRPRSGAASSEPAAQTGPKVVITGGGGGYPGTVNFYNVALAACAKCRTQNPELTTTLVAGPLFSDWNRLQLNGAILLPSHSDLPSLYDQASLIICQAGYNTVMEVLRSGKPTLCVPGERVLDNQAERARLAASRNGAFVVIEAPTVAGLSAGIISSLASNDSTTMRPGVSPDGAAEAARVLARLIPATELSEPPS